MGVGGVVSFVGVLVTLCFWLVDCYCLVLIWLLFAWLVVMLCCCYCLCLVILLRLFMWILLADCGWLRKFYVGCDVYWFGVTSWLFGFDCMFGLRVACFACVDLLIICLVRLVCLDLVWVCSGFCGLLGCCCVVCCLVGLACFGFALYAVWFGFVICWCCFPAWMLCYGLFVLIVLLFASIYVVVIVCLGFTLYI